MWCSCADPTTWQVLVRRQSWMEDLPTAHRLIAGFPEGPGSVVQSGPTSLKSSTNCQLFVCAGRRPDRNELRLGAQSACCAYALVNAIDSRASAVVRGART